MQLLVPNNQPYSDRAWENSPEAHKCAIHLRVCFTNWDQVDRNCAKVYFTFDI